MMRVSFVRTFGGRDRVYVEFESGAARDWRFPSYGANLPHDLVHLVVEAHFQLPGGVWSRVARGIPLDAAPPPDETPTDLAEAEAFAGLPWTSDSGLEALAAAWDRNRELIGIPPRPLPPRPALEGARARLLELRAAWRDLPDRGALRFDVDVLEHVVHLREPEEA